MEDKEKAFELGQRHFELAEKHHREAIILYRLSAEQGDENARNKLKKLLR